MSYDLFGNNEVAKSASTETKEHQQREASTKPARQAPATSKEDRQLYEEACLHLSKKKIKPNIEFKMGGHVFKWHIDSIGKTDQLVIQVLHERAGQNPSNPAATYWIFQELHRKSAASMPKPAIIDPEKRKQRAAKGSRKTAIRSNETGS